MRGENEGDAWASQASASQQGRGKVKVRYTKVRKEKGPEAKSRLIKVKLKDLATKK